MAKKKRRKRKTGSMMRKFVEGLSAKAELKNIVADNVEKNLERRRRAEARDYHYDGDDYHHEKGEVLLSPGADGSSLREDTSERREDRDFSAWAVPGDTVRIGRYRITDGFFYLGHSMICPESGNYVDEPSLVDPELEYTRRNRRKGPCVCYTENYRYGYGDLDPYEKASYLEWLASGRDNPTHCPGYVYIYLCGIERRLLVDNRAGRVSRAEFMLLVAELKRLETLYGDDLEEMDVRIRDLLSYVIMTNKHGNNGLADTQLISANLHLPGLFKFPLALAVATGRPVSAETALAWVRNHPDYSPGARSTQQEEEFDALFLAGYRKVFGRGLKIRRSSAMAELSVSYNPANCSLWEIKSTFNLPDAGGVKAPFEKLRKLAEACLGEVSSHDGLADYGSSEHTSPEARLGFRDDTPTRGALTASDRIRTAMKDNGTGTVGMVPVRSLLMRAAGNVPRRISAKQALMLSEIAQQEGFAIAPDIRFHDARPQAEGNLVLVAGGTGENFTPSETFKKMVTVLRLVSMVLSDDENMKIPGTDLLREEIYGNARLCEAEKHSLHAYLLWRIQAPSSSSGLRNLVNRTLNAEEKTAAGHLAIATAAAAGALSLSSIRRIESIYRLLGLEKRAAAADIHNRLSPERNGARAAASGARPGAESARNLDSNLINAYEKETRSVRAVLENVFEDEQDAESPAAPVDAGPGGAALGLDEKNRLLYERLVVRQQWSREEVGKICSDMELMVDGSIEAINDWAFENAGAPLIEVGNRIFVDQEIAEAINTL